MIAYESQYCVLAYRKKQEFYGSDVNIKNAKCNNSLINSETGSNITIINNDALELKKFFLNSQNLDKLISWISSNNGSILYPERHISSLYFDSDNNRSFLESEEGIVPRKKIRLRSYQNLLVLIKKLIWKQRLLQWRVNSRFQKN